MGTTALPAMATGVTMSYYGSSTNGDYSSFDDYNIDGQNVSPDYFMTLQCGKPVPAGVVEVGPYTDFPCFFAVIKFGSDNNVECYHAVGVSSSQIGVGTGVTFTAQ